MSKNQLLKILQAEKDELVRKLNEKNKQIEECNEFIEGKRTIFLAWEELHRKFIQDLKYTFGKSNMMEYWINQGIDVNYRDNKWRTPLFYCCHYINELLQYGVDVHILDVDYNNCLIFIMKNYCHVDYKPIVEKGIDLFHKNIENQSVFDVTKKSLQDSEISSALDEDGAEIFKEQIQYYKEALIYFEEKGRKVLKDLLTEYLYEELVEIILFFSF